MNKKESYLHAPDVEDANYIEEDYMDPENRQNYEKNILDNELRILHGKEKPDLKLSKEDREALRNQDLKEKVESSINDAALIL
jgi:hypothetical protein